MIKKTYLILCLLCCLGAGNRVFGFQQSGHKVFEVKGVRANKKIGVIEVGLNTNLAFNPKTDLNATETIDKRPRKLLFYKEGIDSADETTLLFLIDVSASMSQSLSIIQNAIADAVLSSERYRFFFAPFSYQPGDTVSFRITQARERLAVLTPAAVDVTNIFYALSMNLGVLSRMSGGKKALILITDEATDKADAAKNSAEEWSRLAGKIGKLGDDFVIFTIAIGATPEAPMYQRLSALSSSQADQAFYFPTDFTPDTLKNALTQILQQCIPQRRLLQFRPSNPIFIGEDRRIDMQLVPQKAQTSYSYRFGSYIAPLNFRANIQDLFYWSVLFIIGVILVFLIFAVLSLMVPFYKQKEFKRKYVKPFKRQGNKVSFDPVTNDPIREGDMVVEKCSQVIPLATWEALGRCPNYPECTSFLGCSGAGAKEDIQEHFFSQKGILKKLNWLFFGSIGGFMAWTVYALYQITDLSSFKHTLAVFFQFMFGNIGSEKLDELENTGFVGICIGALLSLTLAIVEELGQSRKFSYLRILSTLVLGFFISLFTFMTGALLQFYLSSFLAGLLTWLLFGVTFGLVISVGSSVSVSRGIAGGLIASISAFFVYFLGVVVVQKGYLGASPALQYIIDGVKMLSFISLGAIMGVVMVTVVSRLEDFELEYIYPVEYNGMLAPISKWLKSGLEISIGTASKSHVFIKWDDPSVLENHARLSYRDGRVLIEPLGEVLVNGVILPEKRKFALQDNDVVQLGRHSTTAFRYREKRTESKGAASVHHSIREAQDRKRPRPEIKIKRRE